MAEELQEALSAAAAHDQEEIDDVTAEMTTCKSLESLSLGGVAAMAPQADLPKKYRKARPGEVSTYQGAGIVPVCRLESGEVRILLWQPQKGRKKGVRWYDFGGKKDSKKQEFTSYCACRKFAKQTYGIFGCQINITGVRSDKVGEHLAELYQGLSNLPLMLRASQEWAQMQLLDDNSKIFYNDIHEYHIYLLNVPYVPADILGKVSEIVDGGKRVFKWISKEDFQHEIVLAPRLHSEAFAGQITSLADDPWVRHGQAYGDGEIRSAIGCFSSTVV
mmetsp:Transcript_42563/g.76233  ORF Transcript_42563/g.76233 Transcript_42563/m.76233 type:complete len:276 (-) Transcript_42563:99-926(-)